LRSRHRRAGNAEIVGVDVAILDGSPHARHGKRARKVMGHVLLSRPSHFDGWPWKCPRELDRLTHIFVLQARPKTSPGYLSMQINVLSSKPRHGRGHRFHERRNWRSGPY